MNKVIMISLIVALVCIGSSIYINLDSESTNILDLDSKELKEITDNFDKTKPVTICKISTNDCITLSPID